MLLLKSLFVGLVTLVTEFAYVIGRGADGLFMGVLFFVREIKDIAIDEEMALQILQ